MKFVSANPVQQRIGNEHPPRTWQNVLQLPPPPHPNRPQAPEPPSLTLHPPRARQTPANSPPFHRSPFPLPISLHPCARTQQNPPPLWRDNMRSKVTNRNSRFANKECQPRAHTPASFGNLSFPAQKPVRDLSSPLAPAPAGGHPLPEIQCPRNIHWSVRHEMPPFYRHDSFDGRPFRGPLRLRGR